MRKRVRMTMEEHKEMGTAIKSLIESVWPIWAHSVSHGSNRHKATKILHKAIMELNKARSELEDDMLYDHAHKLDKENQSDWWVGIYY